MFTVTKTETMQAIKWTGDNTAEVLEFIKGSRIGYFPGENDKPIFGDCKKGIGVGGIITRKSIGMLPTPKGDEREYWEFYMYHDEGDLKAAGYTWGENNEDRDTCEICLVEIVINSDGDERCACFFEVKSGD